jgi:uncharacterized protein YsxB (DUF464 family)
MIEVTYYREHNRLTVTGHAHSDEYGKDLVCAAVSALALTLEANVRHMAEKDYVTAYTARLDPGDAEISCKAKGKYGAIVERIYQTVCVGFEILAVSHPQYISYEIHH